MGDVGCAMWGCPTELRSKNHGSGYCAARSLMMQLAFEGGMAKRAKFVTNVSSGA